ncbi:MAG: T9SS type A sorting domain-containing protein [Bacteroidetes bacterium]|nr:T9SS type A sorting domain-containing protein [Bacteroidota bacterium]
MRFKFTVVAVLCAVVGSIAVAQNTFDSLLFYGNSKILYNNPYGSGYIAGTNGYGDIGKYQRFDVQEEVTVVGAKFWMALKGVVGTPDSITIVFKKAGYGAAYYDSIAGGPGATIASIKTTIAAFDTTGKGTEFYLANTFNVPGSPFVPESLFVGFEWSTTADDSFALFVDSTKQGEDYFRAWEKLTGVDYSYQRFNEPSDFSWLLDADLWIGLLYKRGLLSVRNDAAGVPHQYSLAQNYPNPFNPSTTMGFELPSRSKVRLSVFTMLGQEVATLIDGTLDAGVYQQTFSARSLTSGVYIYRLQTVSETDPGSVFVSAKKMLLLR